MYNLKRSDIKPDHIEVTTVKTADSLIIELNNHSKAILEKYKSVHFEDHKALPVISRRLYLAVGLQYLILSIALGKLAGSLAYFFCGMAAE